MRDVLSSVALYPALTLSKTGPKEEALPSLIGGRAIIRGLLTSLLLAMTAVLLCLGTISIWASTAPDGFAAPAAAGAPSAEQVANGGGYRLPIDAGLFGALADEDEAGDELPAKAGLLTALVLAIFIGPILWELAAFYGECLGAKTWLPVQRSFHCVVCCRQGRPVVALLAVFRL
jgi:hypothetical protein